MPDDQPSFASLSAADTMLLQRLQDGERQAIATLQSRYREELRLFCQRMLSGDAAAAEDVVQDVFVACCKVAAESRPTTSLRGWLYQIARRRCIDLIRRRQTEGAPRPTAGARKAAAYEVAVDPLTTPAGRALKLDRAAHVLKLLENLDEDLRTVIIMRYFQDLPREEIAEAIGLSLAGAKARLSRAMQILREQMDQLGDSGS